MNQIGVILIKKGKTTVVRLVTNVIWPTDSLWWQFKSGQSHLYDVKSQDLRQEGPEGDNSL